MSNQLNYGSVLHPLYYTKDENGVIRKTNTAEQKEIIREVIKRKKKEKVEILPKEQHNAIGSLAFKPVGNLETIEPKA